MEFLGCNMKCVICNMCDVGFYEHVIKLKNITYEGHDFGIIYRLPVKYYKHHLTFLMDQIPTQQIGKMKIFISLVTFLKNSAMC